MNSQTSIWTWLWAAIAVVAIAVAGYLYLNPETVTVTQLKTKYQQVPQIKTVETIKKVYVPVKQVQVLDKAEVADKLDMPWLKPAAGPTSADTTGLISAGDAVPATAAAEPAPVSGAPQDLQVTTTADIPDCPNGAEAVNVINTETGLSTLIVKEKVAPWFQLETGLVAGLRYGLNTFGGQTGTLYGGIEFMRIKDLHFIGYSELNTNLDGRMMKGVDGKIQLDIQYRRP